MTPKIMNKFLNTLHFHVCLRAMVEEVRPSLSRFRFVYCHQWTPPSVTRVVQSVAGW
jgi:hypothetical protein